MIIKLKNADFSSSNINSLLNSYLVTLTNNRYVNNVSYTSSVDKSASSYTATFSVKTNCELYGVTVTGGTGSVTPTMSSSNPASAGTVVTVSVTGITGNINISFNGASLGGDVEPDEPGSGDVVDPTTPVGLDKVLLSNYRSESAVTLDSTQYGTLPKDTHMTFFDIPINPSAVYYISWGVRAWFLRSDKTPIDTINFYTASNVGQQRYVLTPSDAAYMAVCISTAFSDFSLPDAFIQQASASFTATSSQLISAISGVSAMQDNKGLNSVSYVIEDKEGSWVYEYIPVVAGKHYRIEGSARSWFLNSSKTSTSSINLYRQAPQFTFIAPADAAYISVTFSSNAWSGEKDAVKIEEGTIDYTLK